MPFAIGPKKKKKIRKRRKLVRAPRRELLTRTSYVEAVSTVASSYGQSTISTGISGSFASTSTHSRLQVGKM